MMAMTDQSRAKFNNSLFERDCARAGLPRNSRLSPALAEIIEAQNQTRGLHNAEREREHKSEIQQSLSARHLSSSSWKTHGG